MDIVFIGDIVGPEATAFAAEHVRSLRQARPVDLVIANAENCAITETTPWTGFGMTVELTNLLFESGVDVITSGNHGWDGAHAEEVHDQSRVLRPLNVPEDLPGSGFVTIQVEGSPVSIVNLADAVALENVNSAYSSWQSLADELAETVIIDFHGDSTWEKMIFATAIDGEAAAVLGTHTHEPTANLHILPKGTAFVADVGMTGPSGHPGGFPLSHFARKYRGEDWRDLPPYRLADGPPVLGAVWLRTAHGKTVEIERIKVDDPESRT